ncbi:TPA: hypothetical protein ACGZ92_002170 [Elizabethkingia anophelis]|uniref:hypothetical protein n=1 Tax=Elizabethkingia anophelis TaxID=1117645 RepID=UPI00293C5613|nr:hypothetical protein [Elizabethkingia anophelis]HCD9235936.1 hypothetical protein [Elizabethkingia anophelis]
MKLKLLLNLLTVLILFISLSSCRSEDNLLRVNESEAIIQQKITDQNFKVTISNSYNEYLRNYKGSKFENIIDFRIASQVIKYENGERAMIFPSIDEKENKVNGLLLATLSEDEKSIRFDKLGSDYNMIINQMSLIYNKFKLKSLSSKLYAGIRNPDPSSGECDPSMQPCRETEIPGVIVPGKPRPDPGNPVIIPTVPGNPIFPGGPSVQDLSPADLEMLTPKDPIKDLKEFFKSLDKSKSASLTVYAERGLIGHAFITIKQGNKTFTFGFYPEKGFPKSVTGPSTFNNDSGHNFNTSLKVGEISSSQLSKIMDLAYKYANSTYDLGFNNCTHFTKGVMDIVGKSVGGLTTPEEFANRLVDMGGTNQNGTAP